MTLKELSVGSSAIVTTVGGEGALRQHFLDMGVIPGAQVTLVKFAPMGDPMELRIHGYELTLRLADAEKIEIENMYETYGLRTELLKSKKFYQNAFDTAVNYEALMDLKRELMN